MEETICDVCGSDDNVQCEIYMAGDSISRVYHFCPLCQVELFRRCIDDLVGQNEYKVSEFVQRYADALICESINDTKLRRLNDEDNIVDVFNPVRVRTTKPYTEDEDE